MKKVLYLTTINPTINAFLVPHMKGLIEDGYSVEYACRMTRDEVPALKELNLKSYDIPFERTPFSASNIKAYKMLVKLCKENEYDIVHVHTPVASVYGRLLKLKFPKMKIVYTAHGYHFLKGGSKAGWIVYYPIEKIMSKFTDVLININMDDYKISKEKFHAKKNFYVKGVGIDLNEYKTLTCDEIEEKRKQMGVTKDDFVITMVADLNFNKNQIQLINAIELLKDKCPKIKAFIVGSGEKFDELTNIINQKGLESNIIMLGQRTDVNEIINISNIGALLSYREGLPKCVMEFMANGKKMIVTDIRGCRDLICNEKLGSLVKIADYQGTADKIEEYYNKKDDSNFTDDYIKEIIKDYDIKKIVSSLNQIYENNL